MRIFKTVEGHVVDDIKQYTLNILQKNPYTEIHVGTDSQSSRKVTRYAIVIAYKYGGRGVHYIVSTVVMPKVRDKWTRLYKEAEFSIELASWLKESIPALDIEVDLDFNEDAKHFSSSLVHATSGWATSLGFKVNIKPNNQIATKAADNHCR